MNRCADCKHWNRGTELGRPPAQWGECAKLDEAVSAQCDCSYEYSSDVVFSTPADFYCSLFEAK